MAPTDPCCTIRTNIETKSVHITSLYKFLKLYRVNKKTRIIIGTVLEVEIGQKVTALGMCRTFVVVIFDLGGGDMKVDTINIRIVKLHTPEPSRTTTCGYGGKRAAAATTTTTGDTTVKDPVSVQFLEALSPDPLNDEAFRLVVAQPMSERPGQPLSPLT